MSVFQKFPMDIVKYILPYDSRFVLRKEKIIQINKLDMNKFKTASLNLLLFFKKPKIICELRHNKVTFWSSVRFSNGKGIYTDEHLHFFSLKTPIYILLLYNDTVFLYILIL